MKILHIIRMRNDALAMEVAAAHQKEGYQVALLLLHDAVLSPSPLGIVTYACRDDVRARGIESQAELLDYDGIIEAIFAYDKVVCW